MTKKYVLRYSKEAEEGYKQLEEEGSKAEIDDFWVNINRLKEEGIYGKPLEDKNGRNLEDCFKIYFGDRKWRIVTAKHKSVIDIVDIIAIGKRENLAVYETACQVLNLKEEKDA